MQCSGMAYASGIHVKLLGIKAFSTRRIRLPTGFCTLARQNFEMFDVSLVFPPVMDFPPGFALAKETGLCECGNSLPWFAPPTNGKLKLGSSVISKSPITPMVLGGMTPQMNG